MGDKIMAKQTAEKLGIPVVPGSDGAVTEDSEAKRIAKDIGYDLTKTSRIRFDCRRNFGNDCEVELIVVGLLVCILIIVIIIIIRSLLGNALLFLNNCLI